MKPKLSPTTAHLDVALEDRASVSLAQNTTASLWGVHAGGYGLFLFISRFSRI